MVRLRLCGLGRERRRRLARSLLDGWRAAASSEQQRQNPRELTGKPRHPVLPSQRPSAGEQRGCQKPAWSINFLAGYRTDFCRLEQSAAGTVSVADERRAAIGVSLAWS